jgi:outer membrane protein TolC
MSPRVLGAAIGSSIALSAWSVGPAAAAADPPAGDPPAALSLLAAVRLTLEHDPNVAIEAARVDTARGSLLVESGVFDPVVSSGLTPADKTAPKTFTTNQETRTLQSTLGVSKQFRNGLSIEPGFEIDRSQSITGAAPGAQASNLSTVTFKIRQPLLRGRGRAAVQAAELAAGREVVASGFDLRHTVAQRVLAVATQYWQVRAAEANLDVLRASERSSGELLANTRKLIAADQVPAADLVQLEASLAAAESARIGGERDLFAQRSALGREIGLDAAEIAALPLPADPFPGVRPEEVPPAAAAARPYIDLGLRHRADLEAARQRLAETDLERPAAENALKPQLDLVLSPGYSGLTGGANTASFFSPLYRNVPGASAVASLVFSWPTFNQAARGNLLRLDAARRQNALAVELVAKGIGADVPAALDAVRRDAFQLGRAAEAVRLYERAVGNEEKKLKGGSSTLLDLISQKDRLTAAGQAEVASELALALAILNLRFQTGTLVGAGSGGPGAPPESGEIEGDRLTTLPAAPPAVEVKP